MTYHLNKKWKVIIVGGRVFCCVAGLAFLIPILFPSQSTGSIGPLLTVSLLFVLMGIELIYEGTKTKIEVFDDRIVYYQSRYIFSANWHDLQKIMPSPGALVLLFSKSQKVSGGFAYSFVKAMNMHSSLAINYYLSDENRGFIRDRIIAGKEISDENELRFVNELI